MKESVTDVGSIS